MVDRKECPRQASLESRKERIQAEKALVVAEMAVAPERIQKRLERIGNVETGAWLTVVPDRLNNILLSMEEIRDNLCLCYGM